MKTNVLVIIIILLIFTLHIYAQDIPGEVWLMPEYAVVSAGQSFITSIHVNTGDQKLSAYGFDISYDSSLLALDTSAGSGYIIPGPEGFVSAIATADPNPLRITGFDENGTGPGTNLNVVIIHWVALSTGMVDLDVTVNALSDETGAVIGSPAGITCTVPVVDPATQFGDMDNSGSIDIIDALLVAQYYVGLIQTLVEPKEGDVNADGLIDIIDALMIAQYYVGLLDELPVIAGLARQNTEIIPVYPDGVPPVIIYSGYNYIQVTLRDAVGAPLPEKEIYCEGDAWLSSDTVITDADGIASFTASVLWDGGWDILYTLLASFAGDEAYASSVTTIKVREISYALPQPTIAPTSAITPDPTPLSDPVIEPYYLEESEVTSNVVHGTSATTVTITVTFPDDCKSMSSWGAVQLNDFTYTVDTTSEQITGISCSEDPVESLHGYYLGSLDQGDYTFNFYNYGTLIHTVEFTVTY